MLSTADRLGCINSYDKRGSVVFRIVKALGSGRVESVVKKGSLADKLYQLD